MLVIVNIEKLFHTEHGDMFMITQNTTCISSFTALKQEAQHRFCVAIKLLLLYNIPPYNMLG